jgi:hypothetical protein
MVQSKRVSVGSTNTASHSNQTRQSVFSASANVDTKPKLSKSMTRVRGETSTWKVDSYGPHDYSTEKREKFTNPKTRPLESPKIAQQDPEANRRKMQDKAVKKFEALALKRYGSMDGLFKAVGLYLLI